jgi:preprotein translocase subunit SecA
VTCSFASITFQNYFRLYPKLAGMTGTAMTEADEFEEIYKLSVVDIPTNVPVARKDEDDEVYRSATEKYTALAGLIAETRKRGQPVLVGTTSIEKSELLSELLKREKVPHAVLNARFHEQEAVIISQAGAPGAVTIATNMAGRGTDIKLGGNVEMRRRLELGAIADPEEYARRDAELVAEVARAHDAVVAAGGLFVIGTERHESRRIDNQLRGRSGRQGDPGHSRFFLSLEDDLMRIFGSDRMGGMLQRLGLKEGEAITHPWINRALEKAQKKVEARNFDTRKNLLKYDDVMNDQRREVYGQRREYMKQEDVSETVAQMRNEVIGDLVARRIPEKAFAEQWETAELAEDIERLLGMRLAIEDWGREEGIDETHIRERIEQAADAMMAAKAANFGPELMRMIEKSLLLQTLDQVWKEHLLNLDHLRQGIGLRAYGQLDPLREYKTEAFALFGTLLEDLKERVTASLARVEFGQPADPPPPPPGLMFENNPEEVLTQSFGGNAGYAAGAVLEAPVSAEGTTFSLADLPEAWRATPRNAPCPCGSGKKFKYCHGRLA